MKTNIIPSTDKLTIRELADYYIERYGLETDKFPGNNQKESQKLKYQRYTAQITRILKKTSVVDKTFWDIIKSDGEPRKISISEFEKNCFTKWDAYIKGLDGGYDEKKLREDEERNNIREVRVRNNELLEAERDVDPSLPIINRQRLRNTGYEMMLEAIYEVFYEPFDWEQLENDIGKDMLIDGEYWADADDDNFAARQRLEDYKNYIGKKRNWREKGKSCIQEKARDADAKEK